MFWKQKSVLLLHHNMLYFIHHYFQSSRQAHLLHQNIRYGSLHLAISSLHLWYTSTGSPPIHIITTFAVFITILITHLPYHHHLHHTFTIFITHSPSSSRIHHLHHHAHLQWPTSKRAIRVSCSCSLVNTGVSTFVSFGAFDWLLVVLNAIGDMRGVAPVLRSVLDLCFVTTGLLEATLVDDAFWEGADGNGNFSLGNSWFGTVGGTSWVNNYRWST